MGVETPHPLGLVPRAPRGISHLDYIHDLPPGQVPAASRHLPYLANPIFLAKIQQGYQELDLERMLGLGLEEEQVEAMFYYTQPELDRIATSSYADTHAELVLPPEELEHVLTCVYNDIPREICMPEGLDFQPINDITDLVVTEEEVSMMKKNDKTGFFKKRRGSHVPVQGPIMVQNLAKSSAKKKWQSSALKAKKVPMATPSGFSDHGPNNPEPKTKNRWKKALGQRKSSISVEEMDGSKRKGSLKIQDLAKQIIKNNQTRKQSLEQEEAEVKKKESSATALSSAGPLKVQNLAKKRWKATLKKPVKKCEDDLPHSCEPLTPPPASPAKASNLNCGAEGHPWTSWQMVAENKVPTKNFIVFR